VPGFVDRVDGFQRRHRVIGFPLGVVYKFFDDQGPYLAAILTYYGFIAIFPALLLASSLLGFVLQGNPDLQKELLDSALKQVPIVGTQLGTPEGLTGSKTAVIVGALAAIYGVLGLGQAGQHALSTAWGVPRNSRFNPFVGRARSLVSIMVAGLALLFIAALPVVASNLGSFTPDARLRWIATVISIAVTAVVLAWLMGFTTAHRVPFRTSLPGAVVISVLWHILQAAGNVYVQRVVAKASQLNGVFALVLGLIALLYLAASMAVIGVEVNVVRDRELYPRALLTPFTDAVDLTDADRRAYAMYAKAQRHKGFERVHVTFDGEGSPDSTGRILRPDSGQQRRRAP